MSRVQDIGITVININLRSLLGYMISFQSSVAASFFLVFLSCYFYLVLSFFDWHNVIDLVSKYLKWPKYSSGCGSGLVSIENFTREMVPILVLAGTLGYQLSRFTLIKRQVSFC